MLKFRVEKGLKKIRGGATLQHKFGREIIFLTLTNDDFSIVNNSKHHLQVNCFQPYNFMYFILSDSCHIKKKFQIKEGGNEDTIIHQEGMQLLQ